MTNSRAKGKRGELELSHKLKEYGYETRRGQQYCGSNGDADVIGLPGIHIECKRVEALNIYKAMEQATNDARNHETPVVMHRKDRKGWLVTMEFDDWMKFYEKHNCSDCEIYDEAMEKAVNDWVEVVVENTDIVGWAHEVEGKMQGNKMNAAMIVALVFKEAKKDNLEAAKVRVANQLINGGDKSD